MVWGFYLASFLCAPNLPAHVPFLCAGELQDTALPMEWENIPGTRRSCSVWLPWVLCPCFGTVLERSKDGTGALESPNSTPSSAQDLPWAFHRSFHSFLCSWGWSFHIFGGNKARSFTPDSGRWAGLGAFPKETASLPGVNLLGLHRAHYSLLLPLRFKPNNCSETEKLGILPTGLKYFVCVSLFLNLLWAVGTGQFCPVLLEFALHFWFKSIQLCPTNCPKIRL